jgi:hypothetical protein
VSDTKSLALSLFSLRTLAAAVGVCALVGGAAELASTTSCAAASPNNPLRTFENARNVDVVCMQTLIQEDGGGIPAVPLPQAACTPVPSGVSGTLLPNHLFALVTQVKRGEVAVVDLTGGFVVDEDLGTPGINFLPVGQIPTGIAAAPDGKMSYVATAEVNKPAIYALPSTEILGNSQQLEAGRSPTPPLLTTWPVCALPQTPGSITIIPRPPPEPPIDGGGTMSAGDAGSSDAGSVDAGSNDAAKEDAGKADAALDAKSDGSGLGSGSGSSGSGSGTSDAGAPASLDYVLAVVFPGQPGPPGQPGAPARIATYDPTPLLRGAGIVTDAGPTNPRGALTPCVLLGESLLSNGVSDASIGPPWPDGVKWLEAGVDAEVPSSASCTNTGQDAGLQPPGLPSPGAQPTAAARAGQYLYVSDGALPLIHVFDVSVASAPREIAPLRATSLAQPSRAVTISALAISPTTRDYRRFLYAVDATDSPASIIVYDITDPIHSPHVPLRRPHSNLVPLQPEDRIAFSAGVSALAFVQHDWPLAVTGGGTLIAGAASTGLLCNPNPNVDLFSLDASADAQTFSDPGANYRASSIAFADEPLGPSRLRGIFAFATLSNGEVMTIDVDDWDAPCRRPQLMEVQDGSPGGYTNAITPPEPRNTDGGPYEAPFTGITNGVSWVSDEVFFPVSEPHRPRSMYPLSDNATLGLHFPYLVSAPELFSAGPDGGLGASVNGAIAAGNPALLPTATTFPDPANLIDGGVGVRIAYEDPLAHVDQSWTIDYEGALPSFTAANIEGYVTTVGGPGASSQTPPYWTLFIGVPGGTMCSKGVEDWTIGQQRAAAFVAESAKNNLPPPLDIQDWVGDYLQVTDQLLPPSDPYWTSDPTPTDPNDCWVDFNGRGTGALTDPTDRYNTCSDIFTVNGNQTISLDFPIVQAFDEGLVITRFVYPDTGVKATTNRTIAAPDPTNAPALKQLACCYHNQMIFTVRAGGEWVTTGSASGFLHHMTTDPVTHRCVTSCDPEKALLNGRDIGVAPTTLDKKPFTPDRDSALAMRNPIFAFFMQHPFLDTLDGGNEFVISRPARDFVWQFSLKGELTPLSIDLAATNSSVDPQSMLFIPSLGQLAIVDGSQSGQGLILIDLNAVAVTGNTYY